MMADEIIHVLSEREVRIPAFKKAQPSNSQRTAVYQYR